jgi:uncharacterized protein YfdQ (DUF2303 family)
VSDETLYPQTPLEAAGELYGRDDQAVIDIAAAAVGPQEVEPGKTYTVAVPAGGSVRIVDRDLDQYRARPRRIRGTAFVHDADSFIAYLGKHSVAETEVYADVRAQRVTAVINAHRGVDSAEAHQADAVAVDAGAGWGDHRLQLVLHKTPAWQAWERLDRTLLPQLAFAEHVEDRLVDVVEPAAADLLEVAQTFTAKRRVSFESSQRLSTGQVQLAYREEEEAKAGKRGQLSFPEQITLGLVPFEGGAAYRVKARLRYRIEDGALRIGFVLDRPEDVLRTAFLDDVVRIGEAIDSPVLHGVPA